MAHADEFETSLYLHLAAERVQMDLAVEDNDRMGKFVSSDSTGNYPVRFNDFWGRWTKTGVHGDRDEGDRREGPHPVRSRGHGPGRAGRRAACLAHRGARGHAPPAGAGQDSLVANEVKNSVVVGRGGLLWHSRSVST